MAVFLATAAHAASITNRDDRDFKVTVIEGDGERDYVLKPSEALENICPKGCMVRLDDSKNSEYVLETMEASSIEDGALYHDEPAGAPNPAAGGKGLAPPAKKP